MRLTRLVRNEFFKGEWSTELDFAMLATSGTRNRKNSDFDLTPGSRGPSRTRPGTCPLGGGHTVGTEVAMPATEATSVGCPAQRLYVSVYPLATVHDITTHFVGMALVRCIRQSESFAAAWLVEGVGRVEHLGGASEA